MTSLHSFEFSLKTLHEIIISLHGHSASNEIILNLQAMSMQMLSMSAGSLERTVGYSQASSHYASLSDTTGGTSMMPRP